MTLVLSVALLATTVGAQQSSPAMTHVAHVATGFPGAPDGRGLAVTAAREANVAMLHANFAAGDRGDLEAMKTHVGHVLHALDPEDRSQGPGLGFGVKGAAEAIVTHIEIAVNAEGASEAVRNHGGAVATAGRAVAARADAIAEIARRVLVAETAGEAASHVLELRELALQLDTGAGESDPGLVYLEDRVYSILVEERLLRVLR